MNSYFAKLKPFAHELVVVDKDTVTSGGIAAKDGAKYTELTIKEIINGHDITWRDPSPRQSALDKAGKLSHNRNTPVFKAPAGDTPHVFFPNVIGTQFESRTFNSYKGPVTSFVLFRPRRAVQWEGGVGLTVRMRNRGEAMSIDNTAGEVTFDKGLPIFDRWNLIIMESNGDKSRIILNGNQIGGYKTLPPSDIRALYYGTPSHPLEHDFSNAGLFYGLMSDQAHKDLYKIENSIAPIGSLPTKPIIFDVKIKRTPTGFAVESYSTHSPNGVPLDEKSIKWEWIQIDGGNLETQKVIGSGVKIDLPKVSQELAVIGTAKDRDGKAWTGTPFRSEFLKDERT